jgi:AmmeMemoRadiSam system protein B
MQGQAFLCLRDPEGLAEQPIFLPAAATLIVAQMDGSQSLRDIQADFLRRTGEIVPFEQLEQLAAELDRLHYLDSPAFEEFRADLMRRFKESATRGAAHAGSAYAGTAEELRQQIDGFFAHPDGPGRRDGAGPRPPLRGLIAPHIDFHRGGPAYAHAYGALGSGSQFERYVIFGTCHAGMRRRFGLTEKSYETPLGSARTDRDFVHRLAARLSVDYFDDEFAHRNEHSIEFQAVCLRYLLGAGAEFEIVPILVASFHDLWNEGKTPADDPGIRAMTEAVTAAIAESPGRTCVIAGADLAHVGARFGDPDGPTPDYLAEVERRDRELLDVVAAGDAEGVYGAVFSDGDRRRICGYPPIYMTLCSIPGVRGELLQYRQWSDLQAGAAVTYASVALY